MTSVQSTLDDLDEALANGISALEIAERLGDLRLRILAMSCLEQTHYYRGEYEKVVEFAVDILAALPTEWIHEHFGLTVPVSVVGRAWLIMSLAELGRFAETTKHQAQATRLAEPTQHAFTIAWAHFVASMVYLLKGEWAKARSRIERWIAVVRTGNVAIQLPWAIAASAWALAQTGEATEAWSRVREAEQLLDRQGAGGLVAHHSWAYGAVSRACLLLGRLDEARRLADRSCESSRHQPGFSAHALHLLGDIATHPDRFDAESGAAYFREALTLAEVHGMRPVIAHCHLGLGKLYRHIGETEHAHEKLTAATTMYREMEMGFWLGQGEAI